MTSAGTDVMRAVRRPHLLPGLAIGIAALVGVAIVSVTAGRLVAFELWPPPGVSPSTEAAQLVVPAADSAPDPARSTARGDRVAAAGTRPADAASAAPAGTRSAVDGREPTGLPPKPAPPPPPPPAPAPPPAPVAAAAEPLAPVGALAGGATDAVARTLRTAAGELGREAAPVDPSLSTTVTQTGDAVGAGVTGAGQAVGDLLGGPGG